MTLRSLENVPSSATEIPIATPTPDDPNYVILTREYEWLVPSIEVMELQELLEIGADGLYGPGTREAHIAALEQNGLPLTGVPNEPTGCNIVIGEDIFISESTFHYDGGGCC